MADIRLARAALTRLMEPSDLPGLALIRVLGPWECMRVIVGHQKLEAEQEQAAAELLLVEAGARWRGLADGLERWRPRLPDLAAERDLRVMQRLAGGLLIPEDQNWPKSLQDLGLMEPIALWFRGSALVPTAKDCVSIVGSRDCSDYGRSVTAELSHGLALQGKTVFSGGAYGIDAAAHSAALGTGPTDGPATIAVMAGGLDRFYPSGNEELLRQVASSNVLLAEVPPGTNPTKYRFLQRNRLIAALSGTTVVVEARWRSGALNTAHHAAGLGRQVAAIPGSVYSANSAGCHRLLREGAAVCVTDAAEVLELMSASGEWLAGDRAIGDATGQKKVQRADHDDLAVEDLLLLDALPVRNGASIGKLSAVGGLGNSAVHAGLGRLELLGLARRTDAGWVRASSRSKS